MNLENTEIVVALNWNQSVRVYHPSSGWLRLMSFDGVTDLTPVELSNWFRPDHSISTNLFSPSFEATSRPRRSATGCVLFGCSYHTLLHRLHQIHNTKQKETHAPERHMSPNGYGRRRRALPDGSQPSSESDRKRRSGDADQRVSRHNCTCTEA